MLLFNSFEDDVLFFRPVEGNEISFNSWIEVKKDQAIVVLYPLDLTAALDLPAEAALAWMAAASVATTRALGARALDNRTIVAWGVYNTACDKAKSELETTGKIKGYKALLAGSNKLVWISHYDLNMLRKMQ